MSLRLSYHPLSSFCMKALVALYEAEIPFEPVLVNLGDPEDRARFLKLWPVGKFPVLRDEARVQTVPESSTLIEYLCLHYGASLIPADAETALSARGMDRFFDLHIHVPMQKVTTDVFRPDGMHDPFGVDQAAALMRTAYDILERKMASRTWAAGEDFSIADCAAAPALFYGNLAAPMGDRPGCQAYLARLMARPSFQRVLEEAAPFFQYYPLKDRLAATYPGLKLAA